MSHIFISYSHKDKDYVHKLQETLQSEGFDAWIDGRIDYGDEWLKVIQKHLDECDAFIIVMSNNSFESDMVQNEVTRARDKKKPIFPLLLDGENWLVVQAKQYVDVTDQSMPTEKFFHRLEKFTQRKNKKAEREEAEKVVQEKARLNAGEQARQKIFREQAAREKEKRDVAAKAKRERDEWLTASEAALVRIFSNISTTLKSTFLNVKPIPRVVGIVGGIIVLFWLSSWWIPSLTSFTSKANPSLTPMLYPSVTANHTVSAQQPTRTYTPTPTSIRTLSPTPTSTKTLSPTPTSTKTLSPTPTITLSAEILDSNGVQMVLVPAGEFTMGDEIDKMVAECEKYKADCTEFSSSVLSSVMPNIVYLDAFYIDKYEVTNALYKLCVDAGICSLPELTRSLTHLNYYNNVLFDNYPVLNVDIHQAEAYCKWRNARLPMETQWVKATRGPDSRYYPWGDKVSCTYANYSGCVGDVTEVGSYEDGKSYYGVYDLAGNAEEYVYQYRYPPADGQSYVFNPGDTVKGGAYNDLPYKMGVSYREDANSFVHYSGDKISFGFRCAKYAYP